MPKITLEQPHIYHISLSTLSCNLNHLKHAAKNNSLHVYVAPGLTHQAIPPCMDSLNLLLHLYFIIILLTYNCINKNNNNLHLYPMQLKKNQIVSLFLHIQFTIIILIYNFINRIIINYIDIHANQYSTLTSFIYIIVLHSQLIIIILIYNKSKIIIIFLYFICIRKQ